jgi:hypothetical protein
MPSVMQTKPFQRFTLLASFICWETCLLAAPNIIPELESVRGVSVQAQFVNADNSNAERLAITLKNEGSDTYIFEDDLTSSSLAVMFTLKNGGTHNLARAKEGSFKYITLAPGKEISRVLSLDAHELKSLQIRSWQQVEQVQPYWDPHELYRVSNDTVKAAENEGVPLLLYVFSKAGADQLAQRITVNPRHSDQRQVEILSVSKPLPLVQAPSPKKAPEVKPTSTKPNDEPTSSTPWSIIVLLIVAATCLLWLLLKRRS